MAYRSRKEHQPYKTRTKQVQTTGGCEFCKIETASDQLVEQTASFKVIKNIFPYSFWDYRRVSHHLMIIPKWHTDTLKDIRSDQAAEYMSIVSRYESRGYDVFARSPGSIQKSVPHQHTHLIKTGGKSVKFILYIAKPYMRFIR